MKTKFKDILETPLNKGGFTLASRIHDIGRNVEIIASVCKEKVDSDGEFAKVNCTNIINWMKEIEEMTQVALELQMERDARE